MREEEVPNTFAETTWEASSVCPGVLLPFNGQDSLLANIIFVLFFERSRTFQAVSLDITRYCRAGKPKPGAAAVSPGSERPRGADPGTLCLPEPATDERAVSSQGQAPVDAQRGSY